jgi:hypothetical protein
MHDLFVAPFHFGDLFHERPGKTKEELIDELRNYEI